MHQYPVGFMLWSVRSWFKTVKRDPVDLMVMVDYDQTESHYCSHAPIPHWFYAVISAIMVQDSKEWSSTPGGKGGFMT